VACYGDESRLAVSDSLCPAAEGKSSPLAAAQAAVATALLSVESRCVAARADVFGTLWHALCGKDATKTPHALFLPPLEPSTEPNQPAAVRANGGTSNSDATAASVLSMRNGMAASLAVLPLPRLQQQRQQLVSGRGERISVHVVRPVSAAGESNADGPSGSAYPIVPVAEIMALPSGAIQSYGVSGASGLDTASAGSLSLPSYLLGRIAVRIRTVASALVPVAFTPTGNGAAASQPQPQWGGFDVMDFPAAAPLFSSQRTERHASAFAAEGENWLPPSQYRPLLIWLTAGSVADSPSNSAVRHSDGISAAFAAPGEFMLVDDLWTVNALAGTSEFAAQARPKILQTLVFYIDKAKCLLESLPPGFLQSQPPPPGLRALWSVLLALRRLSLSPVPMTSYQRGTASAASKPPPHPNQTALLSLVIPAIDRLLLSFCVGEAAAMHKSANCSLTAAALPTAQYPAAAGAMFPFSQSFAASGSVADANAIAVNTAPSDDYNDVAVEHVLQLVVTSTADVHQSSSSEGGASFALARLDHFLRLMHALSQPGPQDASGQRHHPAVRRCLHTAVLSAFLCECNRGPQSCVALAADDLASLEVLSESPLSTASETASSFAATSQSLASAPVAYSASVLSEFIVTKMPLLPESARRSWMDTALSLLVVLWLNRTGSFPWLLAFHACICMVERLPPSLAGSFLVDAVELLNEARQTSADAEAVHSLNIAFRALSIFAIAATAQTPEWKDWRMQIAKTCMPLRQIPRSPSQAQTAITAVQGLRHSLLIDLQASLGSAPLVHVESLAQRWIQCLSDYVSVLARANPKDDAPAFELVPLLCDGLHTLAVFASPAFGPPICRDSGNRGVSALCKPFVMHVSRCLLPADSATAAQVMKPDFAPPEGAGNAATLVRGWLLQKLLSLASPCSSSDPSYDMPPIQLMLSGFFLCIMAYLPLCSPPELNEIAAGAIAFISSAVSDATDGTMPLGREERNNDDDDAKILRSAYDESDESDIDLKSPGILPQKRQRRRTTMDSASARLLPLICADVQLVITRLRVSLSRAAAQSSSSLTMLDRLVSACEESYRAILEAQTPVLLPKNGPERLMQQLWMQQFSTSSR
jgi:hypothetical protein